MPKSAFIIRLPPVVHHTARLQNGVESVKIQTPESGGALPDFLPIQLKFLEELQGWYERRAKFLA